MATTIIKDPADVTKHTTTWTLDANETISTSAWSVSPSGLTIDSETETTTTTTVWISGGTDGDWYTLYNTITTSAGRTLRRYIRVQVKEIAA